MPYQADQRFRIEIKTIHAATLLHHGEQRPDRVNAKAVKRVADMVACQQHRRCVGNSSPSDANPWRIRAELRLACYKRLRLSDRGSHERRDTIGRMLIVGIHEQCVCKALLARKV